MTMLDRLLVADPVGSSRTPPATVGTAAEAGFAAAAARRTILTSTAIVVAAMAPMALMTGRAGLEILGPMAIVAVAGTIASSISAALLLPALYVRWRPAQRAVNHPLLRVER